MQAIGFDNNKYLQMQSEKIRERISQFGGKLYLEFGGKLEAWGDYFSFDRWMAAMDACGVDPMFYACRERGKDEFLPWDIVDMGVRRAHLWHEREQAYKAELSPDCRKQCTGCGALALMTEGGKCDA